MASELKTRFISRANGKSNEAMCLEIAFPQLCEMDWFRVLEVIMSYH